jgi:hypothetical protein
MKSLVGRMHWFDGARLQPYEARCHPESSAVILSEAKDLCILFSAYLLTLVANAASGCPRSRRFCETWEGQVAHSLT